MEELQQNIQKTVDESDEILHKVQESKNTEPDPPEIASQEAPAQKDESSAKEQDELVNHNQMILKKYKEGKSAVEIAKELGLGVGEVKLVIGLFREEEL